jgi:hypothetical protein
MPARAVLVLRAIIGLSAIGACCLLTAAPASPQPSTGGYADDPAPQCGASDKPDFEVMTEAQLTSPGEYIAVPGDPTAYTRCVNGAPAGIGHCPAWFIFSDHGELCAHQANMSNTISVDNISQAAPPDPPCVSCPGPPINVAVIYSGNKLGTIQGSVHLDRVGVVVDGPPGKLAAYSGDSRTQGNDLTANGLPHSIVIPVVNAAGAKPLANLEPGDQVTVHAVLVYAPDLLSNGHFADPEMADQPLLAAAGPTSQTFTVPRPPS